MATGTVVITEKAVGSVKKLTFAWTATAGGAASDTTVAAFDGELLGFTTIPGTGGDAPDPNYDITITDEDDHDVLLGAGANRHTSDTEHVTKTSLAAVASQKLTLNVSAAGSTNKGTAILYIR